VPLRHQRCERPSLQASFDAAHEAGIAIPIRRERLAEAVYAVATESEFVSALPHLVFLPGTSTLTAVVLAVEIGDRLGLDGRPIGSYRRRVRTETSRERHEASMIK